MNFESVKFVSYASMIVLVLIGYIIGKTLRRDIRLPVMLAIAIVAAVIMYSWESLWFLVAEVNPWGLQNRTAASLSAGVLALIVVSGGVSFAKPKPKTKDNALVDELVAEKEEMEE